MQGKERCLDNDRSKGDLAVSVFTPTLFCLVPPSIKSSFSLFDRAKLLLRVIRGYTVYYQTQNNRLVSYCFLKRNYLRKYCFLQKNTVLINPYYVSPDYRGKGLGGKLIAAAIADTRTAWDVVYAVVKEDNLPSIRTFEKLNFRRVGYSHKHGWSHRLTQTQTELPIFSLTRRKKQEKSL